MRTLTLTPLALLIAVSSVVAQAPRQQGHDDAPVFSVPPTAGLTCARSDVPPEQRAMMGDAMYEFHVGPRTFMVAYDSTGNARSVTELRPGTDSAGHAGTDFHSLMLAPAEFGAVTFLPADPALRAAQRTSMTPPNPMPPAEKEQARALAKWLWAHRCT